MKMLICLLMLAALGTDAAQVSTEGKITYYVQVVRGTDQAKPQDPKWKPVGPVVGKRLSTVFRWNYYWETDCHPVTLAPEKSVKTRVTSDREVEIRWLNDTQTEVRVYQKGKLVRTSRQRLQARMTIMGGDRDNDEAWFVIVRTEKPLGSL